MAACVILPESSKQSQPLSAESGKKYDVTQRTKLKRMPARGNYDRKMAHSILDEALIVHCAYQVCAAALASGTKLVATSVKRCQERTFADHVESEGKIQPA